MIHKHLIIQLVLLIAIAVPTAVAQKAPVKWGKVSEEEIKWKPGWDIGNLEALVLYDYGLLNFSKKDDVTLTRHKRIKFQSEPKDGQFELFIRLKEAEYDQISKVKAQLIQFDKQGKIKVSELEKGDFLVENDPGKAQGIRYTITGINQGSIIEYQYTYSSNNPRKLLNWNFQSELPIMHSEVRATINELVKVDILYKGPILSNKYKNEATNQWVMTNMKEIRQEPYSPFSGDYVEQLSFQVSGFYVKASTYGLDRQMDFMSNKASWDILAVETLKTPIVKSYLEDKKNNLDDVLATVNQEMSERDQVMALYDHTISEFEWNKDFSIYPDVSMTELRESYSGNGAAINLYLIALLKKAGIDANPVLISRRGNGSVQDAYPDLSQFNHLLASVRLYGEDLLMDASDKYTPYNLLPVDDLNGKSLLLRLEDSRWIELPLTKTKASYINTHIDIGEDWKETIKINAQFNNYAASDMRRKMEESDSPEHFVLTNLSPGSSTFLLDSISVMQQNELERPLKILAKYVGPLPKSNVIEIKPIIFHSVDPSLLIAETRTMPVDFAVPFEDNNRITISIPDGYELKEAPQPYELSLPGNKGLFSYQVTVSGNSIKIKSSMKFTEYFFQVGEYSELKEFFEKCLAKIVEVVVLIKSE